MGRRRNRPVTASSAEYSQPQGSCARLVLVLPGELLAVEAVENQPRGPWAIEIPICDSLKREVAEKSRSSRKSMGAEARAHSLSAALTAVRARMVVRTDYSENACACFGPALAMVGKKL